MKALPDGADVRHSGRGLAAAALDYLPRTIPLAEGTKRPIHKDWAAWPATPETVACWWRQRPDSNIGIRTGGGLVVVDLDPRHDGDRSLAQLEHGHGPLPPTLTAATGGGGRHLYYRGPRDLRSFLLGDGLEVKSCGHQVVAPPSVHPETGRVYRWDGGRFDPALIAPLPAWVALLERERRASVRDVSRGPVREQRRDRLGDIPASEYVPALTGRPVNREGFVQCPFHKNGAERTPSLRAYEDPERGWSCFSIGCNAGGDLYSLAARLRGVERLTGREFVKVRYELTEQLLDRDDRVHRHRDLGDGIRLGL